MTFIRRLAGALCLAFCFSAYSNAQELATGQLDPSQVYTTPDLVLPTVQGSGTTPWVNGVYQDSLTCWSWGDPGYCGPNPIVRPSGNVNFSFGWTDLYQQQNISNILPNSGTGLRVNGYNFSFEAKNGNGWDDGRTDQLFSYVQFNDPSGKNIYNLTNNLSYGFNWTSFNFSETFATPFATKDLGSVRYGFVGQDNNFWAGPYGPEIQNISFSLKYSVDPCYVNILSSPSCPGYLEELAKLTTPSSVSYEIYTPVSPSVALDNTTGNVELTAAPPSSAPTSSTSVSEPVVTSSSTPSSQENVASASPEQKSRQGAGVSTSQILSIVRNELASIAATERSVVERTTEQANLSSSESVKEAESIASQAVSSSQTSSVQNEQILSSSSQQQVQTTQTQSASQQLNIDQSQSLGTGLQASTGPIGLNVNIEVAAINFEPVNSSSSFSSLTPQNLFSTELKQEEVEIKSETNNLTDRSNPINDFMNGNVPIAENNQAEKTATVKKNVPNNEAAGGVDIALLQTLPVGFELYTSGMKDNAFYPPKEIYKNQRVVDNERILRALSGSSDRKHQEMVDGQYR